MAEYNHNTDYNKEYMETLRDNFTSQAYTFIKEMLVQPAQPALWVIHPVYFRMLQEAFADDIAHGAYGQKLRKSSLRDGVYWFMGIQVKVHSGVKESQPILLSMDDITLRDKGKAVRDE